MRNFTSIKCTGHSNGSTSIRECTYVPHHRDIQLNLKRNPTLSWRIIDGIRYPNATYYSIGGILEGTSNASVLTLSSSPLAMAENSSAFYFGHRTINSTYEFENSTEPQPDEYLVDIELCTFDFCAIDHPAQRLNATETSISIPYGENFTYTYISEWGVITDPLGHGCYTLDINNINFTAWGTSDNFGIDSQLYYYSKDPRAKWPFCLETKSRDDLIRLVNQAMTTEHYVSDNDALEHITGIPWLPFPITAGIAADIIGKTITSLVSDQGVWGQPRQPSTVLGMDVYTEYRVQIQWPWIALPLLEVILTWIILASCIAMTWRSNILLKSSTLPYLFYGLEGWGDSELEINGAQTASNLEKKAEKMDVVFGTGNAGTLKLRKFYHERD